MGVLSPRRFQDRFDRFDRFVLTSCLGVTKKKLEPHGGKHTNVLSPDVCEKKNLGGSAFPPTNLSKVSNLS